MTQRGFAIPAFLLANWQLIVIGILAAAVVGYVWHCESVKEKHAVFVGQVSALGEKAKADAKTEIARQAKLLKESEANNAKLQSDLSAANRRLRDERSRRSVVPPAPHGSQRTDLACFGRAELEQALRRLDEGISGLLDEGDQNTLRLKVSRDWAAGALGR